MSLRGMLTERCDILRKAKTGTGPGGEDTFTWPTLAANVRCAFSGGAASEVGGDRLLALLSGSIMFADGQDIGHQDRVKYNGQVWEVAGPPVPHKRGSRAVWHLSVPVELVQ